MRVGSRRPRSIVAAAVVVALAAACGAGDGGDDAARAEVTHETLSLPSGGDGSGTTATGSAGSTSTPLTSPTAPPTAATTAAAPPGRAGPAFAGDFPDPFVLYADGVYYAARDAGLVRQRAAPEDSEPHRLGAAPARGAPGDPLLGDAVLRLGARVAVQLGGAFVLYYSALEESSGLHCVSVAVSSSPGRSVVNPGTEPLVCPRDLGGCDRREPGDGPRRGSVAALEERRRCQRAAVGHLTHSD